MPSRADMDRPARMTAAIVGVVLIAITLPYFVFVFRGDAGSTDYTIAWGQETAGERSAQSGAANADTVVTVTVTDVLPSNATVTFEPCTDSGAPPLSSPASITWTLREGSTQIGQGTYACGDPDIAPIVLGTHPDVGSTQADSAGEAEANAYEPGDNRTATYTLTFRWSRPAGATGPLPLPAPGFTATGNLEIQKWRAVANEQAEVPR